MISEGKETEVETMTNMTRSYFRARHASRQYELRSSPQIKLLCKMTLGHPPLALAAQRAM